MFKRGKGNDGGEAKNGKPVTDLFFGILHLFLAAADQVPFVQNDDNPFASLHNLIGDLLVLIAQPLFHIDHKQDHIGILYGFKRAVHRIVFDILPDFAFFPDARGIHKTEQPPFVGKLPLDDIPGGAGDIGNQGLPRPRQGVGQG